mgnify:CR=1 FL=1
MCTRYPIINRVSELKVHIELTRFVQPEKIEIDANERAVNEKSQYCFFVCTTFDSFLNDLYKKDRKPYLTVARDIQLYKTCNKKSKSFIVKRGEKAKILKCYIGNKHVMYQIKTKSGKQGWFYTDNKVTVINNKLFEEIVYAG